MYQRIVAEQEAKYRYRQRDSLPYQLGGLASALLPCYIALVWANTTIAQRLSAYVDVGSPTVGSLYLSPLSLPLWAMRCVAWRSRHAFPVCATESGRSLILTTVGSENLVLLIVAVMSVVAGLVLGTLLHRSKQRPMQTHGDARWGNLQDLARKNYVPALRPEPVRARVEGGASKGDRPSGFYAGILREGKKTYYVRLDDEQPLGILLVGPPNSGKSSCFYAPFLLTWEGSALIYDPSGELFRITGGARRALGNHVLVFDPENPEISCHFNPADAVRWETRREIATLQYVVKHTLDADDKAAEGMEAHWIVTGSVVLEATFAHLHYVKPEWCNYEGAYNYLAAFDDIPDGPTGVDQALMAMMNTPHDPELRQGWLDDEGRPTPFHPYVVRSARETLQKAPNEKSGVISTTRRFLHEYRDPILAELTAYSDFDVEDLMLLDDPVSLYLKVSPRVAKRIAAVTKLLVNLSTFEHMGDDAIIGVDDDNEPIFRFVHRLAHCIDEAAQLRKQPELFLSYAMARKYGIFPILGYQDVSQIWAAAGGEDNEAVMSVMPHKIFLRPSKPETADWISDKLLRTTTGETVMETFSGARIGPRGSASVSRTPNEVPLMTANRIMELEEHVAIARLRGLPPVILETLHYKADPELRRRSEIRAPKRSEILRQPPDWVHRRIRQIPIDRKPAAPGPSADKPGSPAAPSGERGAGLEPALVGAGVGAAADVAREASAGSASDRSPSDAQLDSLVGGAFSPAVVHDGYATAVSGEPATANALDDFDLLGALMPASAEPAPPAHLDPMNG